MLGLVICHFFIEESARNKRIVAYCPISWLRVKEGKFLIWAFLLNEQKNSVSETATKYATFR